MRRLLVILLLIICIMLSSCNRVSSSIEGYWMDDRGGTISFMQEGKAVLNGDLFAEYSCYGKNNMCLLISDTAVEFFYDIQEDTLTLTYADDGTKWVLYRDIQKHEKIKQNLNSQENISTDSNSEEPIDFDNVLYYVYKNSRYGYTISFPEFLIPQGESINGAGQSFVSETPKISLSVWGDKTPMIFEETATLDGLYDYTLDNLEYKPTYQTKESNFFVLSGVKDGEIIYEKHILKSDLTQNVFRIKYPQELETEMDGVVTYLANNLKTGVGIDSEVEK